MLKIEEDMSIKTELKNLNTKGANGIKGGFEIKWNQSKSLMIKQSSIVNHNLVLTSKISSINVWDINNKNALSIKRCKYLINYKK